MLRIARDILIREDEIEITFVRASGPGGQNVNKLSTAAQLRFDSRRLSLAPDRAARLERLAGQRMTKDGVIVIHAQRFRTQERNRADAVDRLVALLRDAAERPTPRRATKPTLGSKKRRLEGKKRRGDVKAGAVLAVSTTDLAIIGAQGGESADQRLAHDPWTLEWRSVSIRAKRCPFASFPTPSSTASPRARSSSARQAR